MRAFVLVTMSAAALACSSGSTTTPEKQPPPADGKDVATTPPAADAPAKPDPCGAAALGLDKAVALSPWLLPTGCTPTLGGDSRTFVRSADELKAALTCAAGPPAGLDFNKNMLLAVSYTLSPAGVGLGAFDDGKLITLVSRQRSPCPDDPRPMPMNSTAWFLVPAGGDRTFADRACTIESTCK